MNRLLGIIILCCVAATLTGCGLSPSYVRPDTGLPGGYALASEAGENDVALGAYTADTREWWLSFDSKALPELQKAALAGNHNFAAQRWALAQTIHQARAGRGKLLPSIDVSASGSRRGSAGDKGYSVSDSVSGTVQASYELDIWGKNLESASAGEYKALAGMYAWRGVGLSLESEVALTYFSYLAARENLDVYDSMLSNARDVLAYQEKRERLGAAAPLDVTRQRQAVENMEAERIGYLMNRTEAWNNLAQLLGVTEMPGYLADLMEGEKLLDIMPPPVDAGLPSELLHRRPDIAQAEANLLAANANIGVARASFLPSITLTASAGWSSDALHTLISPASALYSLASSLLAPIFNNGQLIAQYDQALAAKEELLERYRDAAITGFWEVSTSLSSNALLEEQEQRRIASAKQAGEAYRIARARYENGAEDFLSVLDAQSTMLSAENSLVQVHRERLNGIVSLFKALGGGWSEEGDLEAMRREFETLPAMTF
ncbi:efflux transporter outer membrane subunit [Desulfovibrio sp. OttesenSCG-928-I05]|nr:efflux transporter outer membrane subunit [Desulfovibrio sp. OttesenSCG-928-I05]